MGFIVWKDNSARRVYDRWERVQGSVEDAGIIGILHARNTEIDLNMEDCQQMGKLNLSDSPVPSPSSLWSPSLIPCLSPSPLMSLCGCLSSALHASSLRSLSSQAACDFGHMTEESRMSYITQYTAFLHHPSARTLMHSSPCEVPCKTSPLLFPKLSGGEEPYKPQLLPPVPFGILVNVFFPTLLVRL